MNEFYIRNVVEAALLAAGKSLSLAELGQLFDDNNRPKVEELRAALEVLATEYASRALEVKETAAGFRIQVRKEFSSEISRLWPERPAKYSRALLETLALIAYRQPITRAEIEAVRGVAVNPNILKTVIERNWVRVVGHRDVPGRPELLGTTRDFLDYFGLRSLDELPPLAELKAMGEYNLQLELPNAGALGIESRADGVEGGVPGGGADVAGLLGVDVAEVAIADGANVDAAVGEGGSTDVVDGVMAADIVGREAAGEGAAGVEVERLRVAEADVVAAELDAPAGAEVDAADLGDVDAMAVVAAEFGGAAVVGTEDAGDDAASGEVASVDVTVEAIASDVYDSDIDDAEDDSAADRTLSAEFVAMSDDEDSPDADAPDPDDSETPQNAGSDKLSDAPGDGTSDDDDDEDELSADGHDSRELVAAPPIQTTEFRFLPPVSGGASLKKGYRDMARRSAHEPPSTGSGRHAPRARPGQSGPRGSGAPGAGPRDAGSHGEGGPPRSSYQSDRYAPRPARSSQSEPRPSGGRGPGSRGGSHGDAPRGGVRDVGSRGGPRGAGPRGADAGAARSATGGARSARPLRDGNRPARPPRDGGRSGAPFDSALSAPRRVGPTFESARSGPRRSGRPRTDGQFNRSPARGDRTARSPRSTRPDTRVPDPRGIDHVQTPPSAGSERPASPARVERAAPRQSAPRQRPGEPERLQKVLSRAGLASRREAEDWIRAGRITINGAAAVLGSRVIPSDQLRLDGRLIRQREAAGGSKAFVCHRSPGESLTQPNSETAASDGDTPGSSLIERLPSRAGKRFITISPMPRVDGGLELVTSDGALGVKLQRSVRSLISQFSVRVLGELSAQQLEGILGGRLDSGEHLEVESCEASGGEAANRWYTLVVKGASGKEVRQLFERQGALLSRVQRTHLGPLTMERSLGRGQFRELTPEELGALTTPAATE